jgi:hypothetical protein
MKLKTEVDALNLIMHCALSNAWFITEGLGEAKHCDIVNVLCFLFNHQ